MCALTRVENAEREAELLDPARHATASQLERLLRTYRRVVAAEREAAGAQSDGSRSTTTTTGACSSRGRLPAEDGALVVAALEAARDQPAASDVPAGTLSEHGSDVPAGTLREAGESGPDVPAGPSRRSPADALVAIADAFLARGAKPAAVSSTTALHWRPKPRRLACEASIVRLLERVGALSTRNTKPPAAPVSLTPSDGFSTKARALGARSAAIVERGPGRRRHTEARGHPCGTRVSDRDIPWSVPATAA